MWVRLSCLSMLFFSACSTPVYYNSVDDIVQAYTDWAAVLEDSDHPIGNQGSDPSDVPLIFQLFDEPALSTTALPDDGLAVRITIERWFFPSEIMIVRSTQDGYSITQKVAVTASPDGTPRYKTLTKMVPVERAALLTEGIAALASCPRSEPKQYMMIDGVKVEVTVADGESWTLEVREGERYCNSSQHGDFHPAWTSFASQA